MRTKYMFCEMCNIEKTTREQQNNKLCRTCSNGLRKEQANREASLPARVCSKCLIEKPNTTDFFYYHSKHNNRFKTICKTCDDSRKTEWNQENIETKRLHNKKTYHKNKHKIAEKAKLKRKEDPSVREYYKRYFKEVTSKIPSEMIRRNISRRIHEALNGQKKGKPTFEALGYTPEQLKEHLESQFDDKMTWDNYGSYWHIDHIIPHSSFHYSSVEDEDFKKCWKLDNLQPLEAGENIRKSNKMPYFQTNEVVIGVRRMNG